MKKKLKQAISLLLAVVMVLSAAPANVLAAGNAAYETKQTLGAPTPSKVNETVGKFTDSMQKFLTDTSAKTQLQKFLTVSGGLTSAANGVIGVLQMAGIIKDPTKTAISQVLYSVKDVQTKLNEMDTNIKDIQGKLEKIESDAITRDRSNNAKTMLKNWQDFNTNYSEPLDDLNEEYQSKINAGIKKWWESGGTQGGRWGMFLVYNAEPINGDGVLGFSEQTRIANSFTCPIVTMDNGENVGFWIFFDKDCIPNTRTIPFDINTYRNEYVKYVASRFRESSSVGTSNGNSNFRYYYNFSSNAEKQAAIEKFANDLLNTQIYFIAKDVMSQNDEWVTKVTNAYRKYCDNVLNQNSGIDAMLNSMYLTHGFEGEIKDDLDTFCDSMITKTGVYGQFALTCACQDDMVSLDKRQEIQQQFVDTIDKLSDKKAKAKKGYDNYCYVTGTVLSFQQYKVQSTITVKTAKDTYKGYSSTPWQVQGALPAMADSAHVQVLYNQYSTLKQGQSSFANYLKTYKVGKIGDGEVTNANSGNKSLITTNYRGPRDFSLDEGINMYCQFNVAGNYFSDRGNTYNINVGNNSKIDNKYFHVHDKVTCDFFDVNSGELSVDKLAGARAFYGESEWYWGTDEAWTFYRNYADANFVAGGEWDRDKKQTTWNERFWFCIDVLKSTAVNDMNGDVDENDPFFAFEAPTLTPGVSDQMGPSYKDTRTALSSLTLKAASYTYTGKAIKPKFTVKAGKKTVPASGYTVSYEANKNVGMGRITVKAKGNYAGSISSSFTIVPKGTALSSVKKNKTKATVKWKKQAAKMPSSRITGYQIRYSTKQNMKGAKTVSIKGYGKTSQTIKGLKKNQKYYFQIRTYATSKKGTIYSTWSKKKAVK